MGAIDVAAEKFFKCAAATFDHGVGGGAVGHCFDLFDTKISIKLANGFADEVRGVVADENSWATMSADDVVHEHRGDSLTSDVRYGLSFDPFSGCADKQDDVTVASFRLREGA